MKMVAIFIIIICFLALLLNHSRAKVEKLTKANAVALQELRDTKQKTKELERQHELQLEVVDDINKKNKEHSKKIQRVKTKIIKEDNNDTIAPSLKYAVDFVVAGLHSQKRTANPTKPTRTATD